MANHFYLYDCEKKVDIAIASSETVIGRDSILQCDDKRISRQHGIIKHDGEQAERTIQITSTHTNPIFLRTEDQVLNILTKDLTATLRHGEKFALLPDQYWFEVRFKDPEVEESAAAAVSSSSSPSKEEPAAIGTDNGELLRVRTMEEVNSAVAEQRVLPDWMTGGAKRKNGDESSEADSTKRAKCADDGEGACGGVDVPIVVKTDPDAAEASTSRPKSPPAEADKQEIKKETADSTSSPPGRPSCEFGIRCYRRTGDHRTQFAHPNDSDYRRPTFPPAPTDAPQCPYGVTCYRRNPQHFRDFQHPDSSEYKRATVTAASTNQQVPAAGQLPVIDANRRRRRRLARDIVIAAMVNPDLFDSDDDEDDGEDLFDADSDSDEYRPDGGDDGDDDDEEDEDEEEQINFRVLNDDENEE